MTRKSQDKAEELFQSGLQEHRHDNIDGAFALYQQALALNPDHAECNKLTGVIHNQRGDHERAIPFLEKAIGLGLETDDLYFSLAVAEILSGQADKAFVHHKKVLEINPDHVHAAFSIGTYHLQRKEITEAIPYLEKTVRLDPAMIDAWYNLALAKLTIGDYEEAIALFKEVLRLQDNYQQSYYNIGYCLHLQKNYPEAIIYFDKSAALNPDFLPAWYNLGNALNLDGKHDLSNLAFDQLLERVTEPPSEDRLVDNGIPVELSNVYYNKSLNFINLGDFPAAIEWAKKSLQLRPDYADAIYNLANAYQKNLDSQSALDTYDQLIADYPDYAQAYINKAVLMSIRTDFDAARTLLKKADELCPNQPEVLNNLLYIENLDPEQTPERLKKIIAKVGERYTAQAKNGQITPSLSGKGDKIKLGYLSGDFYKHVIMPYFFPVLENHNHKRFEISLYSNSYRHDETTDELKKRADHWHDIRSRSDHELAQKIADDGIDILIDLSGHTLGSRIRALAYKPAPVQLSWIGYGYTTALNEMDYFLADDLFVPKGTEDLYSEEIVRLPKVHHCFVPQSELPDISPSPALEKGYVTFSSLSRPIRFNRAVIKAWAAILKTAPHARLVLDNPAFEDPALKELFFNRFVEAGVSPDCLTIRNSDPVWDAYLDIDIMLDPFPQNTGATIHEALLMGIPVLTLRGLTSLGCLGHCILANSGLEDWVATTPEQYIEMAVEHAGDVEKLANLRKTLRTQKMQSPFADAKTFTADYEKALEGLYQKSLKN